DEGRHAGDVEHEAEDDDRRHRDDADRVHDLGRHACEVALRDQSVEEVLHCSAAFLAQRSTSGATMSRLAITVTRSASISPWLTWSMIAIAANDPVRTLQRYGSSVPSLTAYHPMSPRALSTRMYASPAGGLNLRGTLATTGPSGICRKHWRR